MNKYKYKTPIRYCIDKVLPRVVDKYSPVYPVVLDHGCGKGYYSQLFNHFKKYNYTGIDKKGRKEWEELKNNEISFSIKDGIRSGFKDRSFNFLLSITSLEHIKDDRQAIFELYRLAKKGSHLIIIVPSKPYWIFQLGRHCYHHYSKKELLGLVESRPFTLVEYIKIGGPLSFLFTWADVWLSQVILLPFRIFYILIGKKFGSKEIEKILNYSLHWYCNYRVSYKLYNNILTLIEKVDNKVKLITNHHLIVLRK